MSDSAEPNSKDSSKPIKAFVAKWKMIIITHWGVRTFIALISAILALLFLKLWLWPASKSEASLEQATSTLGLFTAIASLPLAYAAIRGWQEPVGASERSKTDAFLSLLTITIALTLAWLSLIAAIFSICPPAN